MKKTTTLIICFLIFSFISRAQTARTNLVILAKDGTKTVFALDDKPKITFSEEYLTISSNAFDVEYELSDMLRFVFDKETSSNIVNASVANKPFEYSGEALLFPASQTNLDVKIYMTDGKLVSEREIHKGETLSIPISSFPNGIFLVSVNGVTYKLMKK